MIEIDKRRNAWKFDKEIKLEYIKELISQLDTIINIFKILITFDIGIIALTLTNLVFSDLFQNIQVFEKNLLSISLSLILFSAFFFAVWVYQVLKARIESIDLLMTLNIDEARKIH